MYSQNHKIDRVFLEYSRGSSYIGANNTIRLSIASSDVNNKFIDVFGAVDKKEFRTHISIEKFEAICKKLMKLNPKDIILDAPLYMDASTTEISFGIFLNKITYSVSGLSKGDEKTSRNNFLEVVKMILETTDIKIPDVN